MTTEDFKIDKGVPLPKPSSGRRFRYPWGKLKEVGDSVLIDGDNNTVSARSAALSFARKHKLTFATRQTDEGLRVWRTR